MSNSIACAVLGCNRPLYYRKVLDSLKKNTMAADVDWYFFVDGAKRNSIYVNEHTREYYAKPKDVRLVQKLAEKFPFEKELIFSEENVGTGKMYQEWFKLSEIYDQVIYFEDDMIVSPYYIELMVRMQENFPNEVVSGSDCVNSMLFPDAKLSDVRDSFCVNFWGFSITKDTYSKLSWEEYDQYVEETGPNHIQYEAYVMEKYQIGGSSHDFLLSRIWEENNIRFITTAIPRGRYIGSVGFNSDNKLFTNQGFKNTKKYIFEEDQFISNFNWYKSYC